MENWVQHAIIDQPMLEDVGPEFARAVLRMTTEMLFEAAERHVSEQGGTFAPTLWRLRVARLDANPVFGSPASLILMVDGWVDGIEVDRYDYERISD